MLKRRKITKKIKFVIKHKEYVRCCICNVAVNSNDDVEELVCGDCFTKQIFRTEVLLMKKNKEDKDNKSSYKVGWQLRKKYKAPDGKVYSFGKEIKRGDKKNDRNSKKIDSKTRSIS